MLALSIVTLSAIPIIKPMLLYNKKQIEVLRDFEIYLASEKALAEIKEALYTERIDWKMIKASEKKSICVDLKEDDSPFSRSIFLESVIRPGKEETTWAKLKFRIDFSRKHEKKKLKSFYHTITVRAISPLNKKDLK